jgi:hypothetical protein
MIMQVISACMFVAAAEAGSSGQEVNDAAAKIAANFVRGAEARATAIREEIIQLAKKAAQFAVEEALLHPGGPASTLLYSSPLGIGSGVEEVNLMTCEYPVCCVCYSGQHRNAASKRGPNGECNNWISLPY